MADFLLEIGLEEIPARMIAGAEAELGKRVGELLTRERLLSADARVTTFSTPRRLAVRVEGVVLAQPDAQEEMTGPSWKIAFPNGEAGPAAVAFAKKAGVDVSALTKIINAKGEYVGATVHRKGKAATEVLTAELPKEVLALYWAKNMYWRAGKPERFVRPVRWLVALLDSSVVPLEIAGIAAGKESRGHRILHGEAAVTIASPAAYSGALRAAFVEPEVAARRHTIRKALDHVTRTIAETSGARWREDHELVETVVHLTEWPTVLYGSFESEYLSLPEEVLVTVMRDHQKYFAVEDAHGKLAPHFLTVLNTQVDEQGRAIIRHGNERVLRSRFKDAQFFWETDQKIPLVDRVEMLKSVTFQKELGSYWDKTEGNLRLMIELLDYFSRLDSMLKQGGYLFDFKCDREASITATQLAKVDLTCELVKEFTELQGEIGGLYAKAQGYNHKVEQAIYWQYRPASISDPIPPTAEGQLLGVVDRIQTILEMFRIGQIPTGSKDPFALRRAANAIISILAESGMPIKLSQLYGFAIPETELAYLDPQSRIGSRDDHIAAVKQFMFERLSFYLKDVRGFPYDVVAAVVATDADDIQDAIARAEALTTARGSDDFIAISAAFKRIKNILKQAKEKGDAWSSEADEAALVLDQERALLHNSAALIDPVRMLRSERNYAAALEAIATLRPAVDGFFEAVMVMAPEPELRAARLGLIQSVLDGFSGIADFSEIVVS